MNFPATLLAGLVLATTAIPLPANDDAASFYDDPRAAFTAAQRLGQPVLLYFHASWCEPCEIMDRTTWIAPSVVELLDSKYVALAVDLDRRSNLATLHDVKGTPTISIADGHGRRLVSWQGYVDAERLSERLSSIAERWTDLARLSEQAFDNDGGALAELGDFARIHSDLRQAESCYRRALRRAADLPPAKIAEIRTGLAVVLATGDRCKAARTQLDRVHPSQLDEAAGTLRDETISRCP